MYRSCAFCSWMEVCANCSLFQLLDYRTHGVAMLGQACLGGYGCIAYVQLFQW
jgi:hypothetical protein